MSAFKLGLPIEGNMSALHVAMVTREPKIHVIENDEAAEFTVDQSGSRQSLKLKSGKRLDAHVVGVFVGGAPDLSWLPPKIVGAAGTANRTACAPWMNGAAPPSAGQ
jgi:hypothetical protein